MIPRQRIVRERRQYNQWVATETLEDYALRFTAGRARKSSFRVGNTTLGPIAFLACEAIGASITVAYGFQNAVWAIVAFTLFLIGLPIANYASRCGVDYISPRTVNKHLEQVFIKLGVENRASAAARAVSCLS